LQNAYAELGYRRGDLPVTESAADEFLSLPIYAELQPGQVTEVVAQLNKTCVVDAA
jgi:dTDP-4-amino-4,6-dideoxygalactose transaminase